MKPYLSMKVWAAFALFSSSVLILSCGDNFEVPESGERKTMPLDSFGIAEINKPLIAKSYNFLGMRFETELITLQDRVGKNEFLCVQLNSGTEETVLNLIKTFRPFVSGYLKEWSGEQKGIMLDLRENRAETGERAEYSLEKQDAFVVPLLLLWDANTTSKAEKFKAELSDLPNVNAKKIIQENTNL